VPKAQHRWPRIALRDVFLFTIVLAVALAVVVHTPTHNIYAWLFTIIDCAVIANMGFACCWLAWGRSRPTARWIVAPLIFAFNIIATQAWLYWFSYGLTTFSHTFPETLSAHWADRFRRY